MREEHAEHEHRAVLKGLPRFSRPRDLSQRDRQRSQSHRAEARRQPAKRDRKSTRLNSSHSQISYAVFCLKKKKNSETLPTQCSRYAALIAIDCPLSCTICLLSVFLCIVIAFSTCVSVCLVSALITHCCH